MAKQEITLYSKNAAGKVITQFYPKEGWENPTGVHKAPVMDLKSRGFSPVKIEDKPAEKPQAKKEVSAPKPTAPSIS